MPILRPTSFRLSPRGYPGSQVLRYAPKDGPEQRVYSASDFGLAGYKDLNVYLKSQIEAVKNLSVAIKVGFSGTANLDTSVTGLSLPTSDIQSTINSVRCQSISTKRYFIGYDDGIPQYIEGRTRYRCVDFLSAYLKSVTEAFDNITAIIRIWGTSYANLSSQISMKGAIYSDQDDLPAIVKGYETLIVSLSANVISSYCQVLSTKQYFIGYHAGIPQYVYGRTTYRCVDFLPAQISRVFEVDLGAIIFTQSLEEKNLPAYILGDIYHGTNDLGARMRAWQREISKDLPAILTGILFKGDKDLTAIIGMHQPADLSAIIRVSSHDYKDISASLMGWGKKDLSAFIRSMKAVDLGGIIFPIPGKDLPAYLKVWPQEDLPAFIYSWDELDLGGIINSIFKKDLPASIGMHMWKNVKARIKGWGREVPADLSGIIRGMTPVNLPAYIRSKYFKDLSASLIAISSVDLGASLHGWDIKNLLVNIVGIYGPNDLRASIVGSGGYRPLTAYLKPVHGKKIPYDLSGLISSWYAGNMRAYINAVGSSNLSAVLSATGGSGAISASIYPKMIRLTTMLSIMTMEHLDLSAVINISCYGSAYKDLNSLIRCMYLSNMGASITSSGGSPYSSNLSASIGYADSYFTIDKLPISFNVFSGYRIEDKLPIYLSVFAGLSHLSSSITPIPRGRDLSASIIPDWISHYKFRTTQSRARGFNLPYSSKVEWFKVAELSFQSIVNDYFYVSGENKVYKTDKTEKWRTDVKSYIPEDTITGIQRKLYRVRTIYDFSKFANIDEAIKAAIDYVISYDYDNLSARIASSGGFVNLPTLLSVKTPGVEVPSDLTSIISPIPKTKVVGFDDDGIDVF